MNLTNIKSESSSSSLFSQQSPVGFNSTSDSTTTTTTSSSQDFLYYVDQYWNDVADPRTKDFPLVQGGIWRIGTIMLIYLLLVKKIIPWYMKDRKPFTLKWAMLVYNSIMVIVNCYFFYEIVVGMEYGKRFLDFNYPDRNDYSKRTLRELNLAWWGWMSRLADMLDTIFFALRKKSNQITFLHVYHHTAVPLLGWFSLKVNPLAPIIGLFALFNTAIHSIMYSYYALAAFGPEVRKYLWWKKYITQMQLAQFALCGAYGIVLFYLQKGYPMVWFWVAVGQNPLFFYMFYDFYRRAYNNNHSICAQDINDNKCTKVKQN